MKSNLVKLNNLKEKLEDKLDRKSVVQGKSVDLGGRRIIKKKKSRIRERKKGRNKRSRKSDET